MYIITIHHDVAVSKTMKGNALSLKTNHNMTVLEVCYCYYRGLIDNQSVGVTIIRLIPFIKKTS